jgi:hypothetical protein
LYPYQGRPNLHKTRIAFMAAAQRRAQNGYGLFDTASTPRPADAVGAALKASGVGHWIPLE